MLEIGRQGVEFLDQASFPCHVEIHQVRAAGAFLIIIKIDFHPVALFVQGRPAIGRLELDAVIARGIMRCGDHHAGDGMQVLYRIGDDGRRGVRLRQVDDKAVGSQDARHISGVPVGQEACIEANHKFLRVGRLAVLAGLVPGFGCHCIRNGLTEHAQVGKSKCVRNDGAPAVRTKMDGQGVLLVSKIWLCGNRRGKQLGVYPPILPQHRGNSKTT